MENIAVIDVETTWGDEVMSIGIVIANNVTLKPIASRYYLINPEFKKPAMYSNALMINKIREQFIGSRREVMSDINKLLLIYNVKKLFAYNAHFDKRHLPELKRCTWCDIMRIAAYKQYNKKITDNHDCCSTGRLRSGYGVAQILKMLSDNNNYEETHNAYYDAIDELEIMRLLAYNIDRYDVAVIN